MTSSDFSIHVFFFLYPNCKKMQSLLLFMLFHAEPEIVQFVYIIELVAVEAEN